MSNNAKLSLTPQPPVFFPCPMEAIRFHGRIPPPLALQIILPEVKVSLIQPFERIYESVLKAHSVYQLEGEEGDKPGVP